MRVEMSGYQFIFPNRCACCCGAPNGQMTVAASKSTGKRVIHTKTQVWDIPYCSYCLSHVRAVEHAAFTAKALITLSVLLVAVLCFVAAAYIIVPVGILAGIGIVVLYHNQMSQAGRMCKATCASAGKAVAYLGWFGTVHQFEIGSLDFAREFMAANQRKLVNLSATAQNLLASTGTDQGSDKPRSPRRYMS